MTRTCDIKRRPHKDSCGATKSFTERLARTFSADCLDEAACRRWVLEKLHPDGARCPSCNVLLQDKTTLANFWQGKRCACKKCETWFTARTGTFLSGSQMEERQVFLIAVLFVFMFEGLTIERIASCTGVSENTVRFWIKKIKVAEVVENERE